MIERRESSKEKMETESRTVKSVKSRSIIKKKKKKLDLFKTLFLRLFIYLLFRFKHGPWNIPLVLLLLLNIRY